MKLMNRVKPESSFWIMKPKASSQGKGITIIKGFDEVPRNSEVLIS
jgi:translation initiation factor 1 (eIF-1/SUI1)